MGFGEIGLQGDGGLEGLEGFGRFSGCGEDDALVAIVIGSGGVDLDGLGKQIEGGGGAAADEFEHA